MKIVFRVDASVILGSGHVMRCLTLAEELNKNHEVSFICSDMEGNLIDLIKEKGFEVFILPRFLIETNNNQSYESYDWEKDKFETIKCLQIKDFNCLIVDHYMLDFKWETGVKNYVEVLFVIDDLANRKHSCDLLLDQNFYMENQNSYNDLVPSETHILLGEKYALLRDEFTETKKKVIEDINSIFIYFGASDISGETIKVLEAYTSKFYKFKLKVLLGYSNPKRDYIVVTYSKCRNIEILSHTKEISKIMLETDLAIGAGGSTAWERCCIGLPSTVVIVAENQLQPMLELKKKGVIEILSNNTLEGYKELLDFIATDSIEHWRGIQDRGMTLFDGYGKKRLKAILEEVIENECRRTL